jgi:hypothetical protein
MIQIGSTVTIILEGIFSKQRLALQLLMPLQPLQLLLNSLSLGLTVCQKPNLNRK